jgi:hypothetical protein
MFENCSFSDCDGGSEKGNWYLDKGSDREIIKLYNLTTLVNINLPDNRNVIYFYFKELDISLDCILSNSCTDEGVVIVDEITGFDLLVCGIEDLKCKTVDFVLVNKSKKVGIVNILDGTYSVGSINSDNDKINLTLKGITKDKVVIEPIVDH